MINSGFIQTTEYKSNVSMIHQVHPESTQLQ